MHLFSARLTLNKIGFLPSGSYLGRPHVLTLIWVRTYREVEKMGKLLPLVDQIDRGKIGSVRDLAH